jgi:diguanylate cyclase (GGDEF)-like protein
MDQREAAEALEGGTESSPATGAGFFDAVSALLGTADPGELIAKVAEHAGAAVAAEQLLRAAAEGRREAEVLGAFAGALIRVQDTAGIAEAAARATVDIVATDRSLVFRHLEESGSLSVEAHVGYEELALGLAELVISPDDTPELAKLLCTPDVARVYDRSTSDGYLQVTMDAFDVDCFAAVPIRTSDRLFGVLTAAWRPGHRPIDTDDVVRRLAAIADQAAGAWEKALLLEQVNRQASVDALTGLANRRVFTEMLANLLLRPAGPPLAVLFCDLDRFKEINDVLGHAAGDDLLVLVGRRLQHCVRSDDLVARLGGDEFTILLTGVSAEWSPEVFAAKVKQAMIDPIEIDGAKVVVRLSIGAIVVEPGTASVKDVLRRADAAMYVAKARGGDRLLSFEEGMLVERSERLELEATLASAASTLREFSVVYQPQVEIEGGRVVGVEALVRWQHPTRGLVVPEFFLALAEETGLVVPIDLHVLRTALADLAAWQAQGVELRMAVNFSARTLTSPGLVEAIAGSLAAAGVPGNLLEIELTESTAVAEPDVLRRILLAIGELGVSVAIDDVGTGYSSLALLHQLPAQRIKIDRSFVQQITDDPASRYVVEAVLLLAERLGQSVVAEGVETVEQALGLKALGCTLAQGYLFAQPAPAAAIPAMVRSGIRRAEVA